jgi:hypothetical protein
VVHGAHLFVLVNDAQAGLEPEAATAVAMATVRNGSKFSQCNMSWGSIPWVRGSRCQKFDSDWCFISA